MRSTVSPTCCSEHQGTQGLEEVAKHGLQEAASLLEDVWALFVLASVQSSVTFPSFPLSPEKLIPEPVHTLCSIILVILSCPQHALVRSKIVLGHP